MRNQLSIVMFAVLALSLVFSACGPATTPTPQTLVQTQIQTQIVVVTPTPGPAAPTPLPAGSVQINGAGATFPLPVYTEWTYAYQYVDPSVVINYQGIGSGGGKKGIVDGTIDFAGSDSLLKDEEYTAGVDLQMYPMLAGAVVPIYNIKLAQDLPAGMTLPEMALRFILNNSTVSTIIPGMRKRAHVEANITAGNSGPLPASLHAELRKHRWDRQPAKWSQ